MDILGKSNRFSYAAAWGMLAYLTADIIFDQQYAVDFQGPKFVSGKSGRKYSLRQTKFPCLLLCHCWSIRQPLLGILCRLPEKEK